MATSAGAFLEDYTNGSSGPKKDTVNDAINLLRDSGGLETPEVSNTLRRIVGLPEYTEEEFLKSKGISLGKSEADSTSPIPILETDNEYPTTDPGSGFSTNPGRHAGGAFTPYKENISDILKHTDERLDRIRNNPDRVTAEDTMTQKLTQNLIDGGVLPGTEGYVSAADKDAERLAGDLAIKDAFSVDESERREDALKASLKMLRKNANKRRDAKDEDLRDRMSAMLELQATNRVNDRPNSIMDFMGTPLESGGPAPIDLTKPEPDKEKEEEKEEFNLPDLPDEVKSSPYGQPSLYKDGVSAPDDFKKNPSFDGRDFDYFLERAKATRDMGRYTSPADPEKNKLYNALLDAGLSEEEMFKGAQYAGITNLRTGDKSIKRDVEAIKHAVDNNYYQDGGLKSEQDLYDWYQDKGGEKSLKQAIKAAGYNKYDSENDADALAQYLTNDLRKSGIRKPESEKSMKQFNKQMNSIENMFGGKFKFSTYQEALEGNKASDVNDWVKNYINLGGGVGRKVTDAINTPDVKEEFSYQGGFGTGDLRRAREYFGSDKELEKYLRGQHQEGAKFKKGVKNQYDFLKKKPLEFL